MLGSLRSRAMMVAALMGAMSPLAPALASHHRVIHAPAKAAKPGRRGLFNDAVLPTSSGWYGHKGAGITMAQQKRAAAKKRGIARNRRSHR